MFRFSLSTVSPVVASLLFASTALGQDAPAEALPAEATAPAAAPAEAAAAEAKEETAEEGAAEEAVPEEAAPAPAPVEEEVAVEAEVVAEAPAAEEAPTAEEEEKPSMLPLKIGTHTWSRFEVRAGYDNMGVSRTRFQEGDQTVFRSRITIESNPLKLTDTIDGLVYFAPQATGQWGTQGFDGNIGEANLGIYEGYVLLRGETLEAKFGRFAMNYGDALMIGNLDWHQSGRAFDGLHLRYKPGAINIDGFITQQAEGQPALNDPFLAGDKYFWGVYAQLGKAISEGFDLDAYVLGKSAAATDITDATDPSIVTHKDGATNVTLGARVKHKVGIFDYRVEAGLQLGKSVGPATENIDKFAYQADGELGLSFAKGLRLSVGGAVASGDDSSTADKNEAWDELYPTTHKWLGLMDVIGFRTNVVSGNLKFKAPLGKSTVAQVHAHLFARKKNNGLGQTGDAKLAGYEIDTMLVQKIGKWAYTRGLYGLFIPNEDHYATGHTAHYGEVQAGLKF